MSSYEFIVNKKQIKKRFDGCCHFCKESNYNLLHSHRIIEGKDGGKYHNFNMITVCANCHNRIHAGEIIIDRKYNSTKGPLLHYRIGDKEFWDQVNN